jgi:hypothetical protein
MDIFGANNFLVWLISPFHNMMNAVNTCTQYSVTVTTDTKQQLPSNWGWSQC